MNTMSGSLVDAARKVIRSLESKPGLFYEVLRIVRDEYEVSSAWQDSPDGRESNRYDTGGKPIGSVTYRATGDRYDWQVLIFTPHMGGSCASIAEAKVVVDDYLRESGYLLP